MLPTQELSPREREVLLTYAQQGTYQKTADRLGIGRETVREHLRKVHRKLNVKSSIEAYGLIRGEQDDD